MRDRLSSAEMAESVLERTNIRIGRLKQQADEISAARNKAAADHASLQKLVGNEKTIAAALEDRRAWRKQADDLSSVLSARQPLLARKQEIERDIRQAASDLERQRALLRQSIETQRGQLKDLDEKARAAKGLSESLAANQKRLADQPGLYTDLQRVQDTLTELTGENTSLRSRMKDIQSRIASLDEGAATCPVCRRPLGEGDHGHIHEEWTSEGKALGDAFRSNKQKIDTLNDELKVIRRRIQELDELARATAGIEANLGQLESDISKREAIEASIAEAEKNEATLAKSLSTDSFLPNGRSELLEIEKQLANLPYDEAAHAEARKNSQDLERVEREYQQLERAKSELESREAQIEELGVRLDELSKELKEAEEDAAGLAKSLEGIAEVRTQHQIASKEREKLGSLAEMERSRGGLRRQLEELDEMEKEQAALKEESRTLSAEADAYGELTTAFGRNGIQAMVIENVLPELEDEANRILSRMTTKQLEVMFRTTREAVSSDSTIETLDIIIRDESGRRPYQMFSGGEAFRINFAIRVALSKLLARRAGASVDTLIIDEGFGTQDQHGRDGLVEAIQSVTRDFALILVITHVDELRYQFPHRIEVVKTDAGSRATLV
ncbi:MAG: SMC family ATPase [Thermomicrobiales bacterium]